MAATIAMTRKTIVIPTLKNSARLERLVDDGRRRQRHPDGDQHDDRDRVRVPADQVGEGRRARGAPAGPHVRDHGEDAEQDAPRLPGAGEAGDRGLPRGERVALDLHVEEVLDRHADDRQVQEADAGVGADVRPQDVLAGADSDARQDHARAEDLAERQRLRHVPVLHRREMVAARLGRVEAHLRRLSPRSNLPLAVVGRARADLTVQPTSSPLPAAPLRRRGLVADSGVCCRTFDRSNAPCQSGVAAAVGRPSSRFRRRRRRGRSVAAGGGGGGRNRSWIRGVAVSVGSGARCGLGSAVAVAREAGEWSCGEARPRARSRASPSRSSRASVNAGRPLGIDRTAPTVRLLAQPSRNARTGTMHELMPSRPGGRSDGFPALVTPVTRRQAGSDAAQPTISVPFIPPASWPVDRAVEGVGALLRVAV